MALSLRLRLSSFRRNALKYVLDFFEGEAAGDTVVAEEFEASVFADAFYGAVEVAAVGVRPFVALAEAVEAGGVFLPDGFFGEVDETGPEAV